MRFFFYGTLIAGSGNPVAAAAHRWLRDLGQATVPGMLYAIPDVRGWYPALLPGAAAVRGRLYAALPGFDAPALAALDAYEEFSPADPAASLYVRRTLAVTHADTARGQAQAYCFNAPLPRNAEPVLNGDFRAWLDRRGATAFGEG